MITGMVEFETEKDTTVEAENKAKGILSRFQAHQY
jgi:hypothetical protein